MKQISFTMSPFVCSNHGIVSQHPCPWPNCEHGIEDGEFCVEPIIDDGNKKVWQRKTWVDSQGVEYYSWQSNFFPHWYDAHRVILSESRRRGILPFKSPEILYQYTSLEGFMGIVSNRSVWMTEFQYLNDRDEVQNGKTFLTRSIEEIQRSEPSQDLNQALSSWRDQLQSSNNQINIASFSTEDDSLSQWRAYGPIAVGFKTESLASHGIDCNLSPVIYENDKKQALAEFFVRHYASAFEEDKKNNAPHIGQWDKINRFLEFAVLFKNEAFKSEAEFRLTYIENPEIIESLGLKKPKRLFRASRGRIIPYITSSSIFDQPYKPQLEISEIVIGPESDPLLDTGVREFLSDMGMSNVLVRRSLVPFRG